MSLLSRSFVKSRVITSRLSSLLLLFQRTPLIQMIFPEARILGGAGVGEITTWAIATVIGLGAYDRVAGATTITQILPNAGSTTVPATNGSALSFIFQVTGAPSTAKSWSVTGTLPNGLVHANATNSSTNSISGVPTQTGSFPITVRAWEKSNQSGGSSSKSFNIKVVAGASTPPIIDASPASVTINSGSTTTLTVAASGRPAPTFQWYAGASSATNSPVSGATSASFKTPALTAATSYWVRATNAAGTADSQTAIITLLIPPAITNQPSSLTVKKGGKVTLRVSATGSSLKYQWYQGKAGITTTPVIGAKSPAFTTPAIKAPTSYWVRITNAVGRVNSKAAFITLLRPGAIRPTAPALVNSDPFTAWRQSRFTIAQLADPTVSDPDADPDGDGITNREEYIHGLLPLASDLPPAPGIMLTGARISLGFTARAAIGPGYAGLTRHYAIEVADTPEVISWKDLSGYSDILGEGQTVTCSTLASGPSRFYRLRVWLKP
ncbi:MAG: immunoglobulin domain-containing protein [Verrucomicrobiota bacterium]